MKHARPIAQDGTGKATSAAIASLAVGSHNITAVYGGSGTYNGSTSTVLKQTVNKGNASTVVSAVSPPGSSVKGESVTITATVTASGSALGVPTGTVTFKDGSTTIGTATLNASGPASAQATIRTSSLNVGNHTSIRAVYGGDGNFNTSTSAAQTQNVGKANTSAVVTPSLNPSTFGQSVTFTVIVSAASPGSGTPTGSVTFKDVTATTTTTLATKSLDGSGKATYSTSSLSKASHSITAVYAGDTSYNTSTSAALNQTVQP